MYTCFLSAVIKTKICLKSMTLLPKGRRGHTCGENCCVCGGDEVGGGGGGGDVFWSDDLSRSGTRSWMKRSPSSAPWFSAGHGGMTACRANKAVSHQPGRHTGSCGVKHLWKRAAPIQRVTTQYSYLSPAFLFTVKSTLLFALLTGLWRSILLF